MIVEHIKSLDLYDGYKPVGDEKHISVTSLLKPAYQVWLKMRTEEDQLIETNKDGAILGSLIHYALEELVSKRIAKHYEERLSAVTVGWLINGQFDLVVDEHVCDYKSGKISKLDHLDDYVWQLSIYRWLIYQKYGVELKDTGFLVFILLDFSILKVNEPAYRKHSITSMFHEVEVKLHSFDETHMFICEQIAAFDIQTAPEQCDVWPHYKYGDIRCEYFCEYRDVCEYRNQEPEESGW